MCGIEVWIRNSDSFAGFFKDELEIDYDSYITKSELNSNYIAYCRKFKSKVDSAKAIRESFSNNGVIDSKEYENGKQVRVWSGVKFKNNKTSKTSKTGIFTL